MEKITSIALMVKDKSRAMIMLYPMTAVAVAFAAGALLF
jgi:hypothetical protein